MHSAIIALTYFFLFMESTASGEMDPDMRQYVRSPVTIQCKDSSTTVHIQEQNQKFELTDLLNGSVKIDFEEITHNNVLLTFYNDQSSNQYDYVNCFSGINVESMVITNLTDDTLQTFCIMDRSENTVSPLDCLSFRSRKAFDDSVWLSEDDKPLAIGLFVMGLLLCLGVGFGIGVLIVRRQSTDNEYSDHQSISSKTDFTSHDWKQANGISDFTYDDTLSIASDKYVAAINPSRFDVIKMKLEKAENLSPVGNENQYDLEDMPYAKAPSVPEVYRDSGISGTSGPVYAISSKVVGQHESENNGENLYLCVDQEEVYIEQNNKKLE